MFEFGVLGVTVNVFGILLAVVANMVWGMVWYGPLFGERWMKLVGKKKKDMKMETMDMVWAVLLALLLATGLNSVIQFAESVSALEPLYNVLLSSAMVAFTFTLPTLANEVIWEGRNKELIALNWAHQFTTYMIMSAVLAFFVL